MFHEYVLYLWNFFLIIMQQQIEALNLLMLNVGFAHHDSDWNWKNVCSPFSRIYYVTKGQAWLHLPSGVVELKPGRMYIIPAYIQHSYECDGVFEHYYLHIYEGYKQESNVFDFYDFPQEVEAKENDEQLFALMCELHPEATLPASDPSSYDNNTKFTDYVHRYTKMPLYEKMELRGIILMLFSRFMQYAQPRLWTRDERMNKALKYIHANMYDDINIEVLASHVCMTKSYLIRLFKRNLGIPPLQYINQKKVERAQLLLITEDVSVKEIAYTLGFNDHSYFIRLFKKISGATPQEYRNRMR